MRPLYKTEPVKRWVDLDSNPKKRWIFNHRWRAILGKQYFVDGEIIFPETNEKPRKGAYRTVYGANFCPDVIVHRNCDQTIRQAMRRLTGTRLPHLPGEDERLRSNQRRFLMSRLHSFQQLGKEFYDFLDSCDLPTDAREAALWFHGEKHPKRIPRIQAYLELLQGRSRSGKDIADRLWLKVVLYKLKKDEYAKFEKYARMIGDMGIAASLQGFWITALVKKCMEARPMHHNGGTISFCSKPTNERLTAVFHELREPTRRFSFVYFSDDSCLALRIGGRVRRFNLDISSCDASHTAHLFYLLRTLVPPDHKDDIDVLIEQCSLPIEVRSVENPGLKVRLKNDEPVLFSGSTLTTIINNLANISIGMAISECEFREEDTDDQIEEKLVTAASRAGYILTGCRPLDNFAQLQFLKNSPIIVDGKVVPFLNVGVMLRASGTCRGDLPGRGKDTIEKRAHCFQNALLQGLYPRHTFPLLRALRSQIKHTGEASLIAKCSKQLARDDYWSHERDTGDFLEIPTSAWIERYDLELGDIEELITMLRVAPLMGSHINTHAVSRILEMDYGYPTVDHREEIPLRDLE